MICPECKTRVRVTKALGVRSRLDCAPTCRVQRNRESARRNNERRSAARKAVYDRRPVRSVVPRVTSSAALPAAPVLAFAVPTTCARDGARLVRVEVMRDFGTVRERGVYACGHSCWAAPPVAAIPERVDNRPVCNKCGEQFTPPPGPHRRIRCEGCRRCAACGTDRQGRVHTIAACPKRRTVAA